MLATSQTIALVSRFDVAEQEPLDVGDGERKNDVVINAAETTKAVASKEHAIPCFLVLLVLSSFDSISIFTIWQDEKMGHVDSI